MAWEVDAPVRPLDGPLAALTVSHCHCARCRKAASAAYFSALVTALDGVRFTRGEARLVTYKVPEARFFEHRFCATCGSSMPRRSAERGITIVPMGSLDDDPGAHPGAHMFVASKAPWDVITDDLPQHDEYPRREPRPRSPRAVASGQ
ncbi:MAG: GFA family protein [Polyangiales bacterium]